MQVSASSATSAIQSSLNLLSRGTRRDAEETNGKQLVLATKSA